MKFAWIERAPDWHQVDLGLVVLTVSRHWRTSWTASVGAVIEEDRSEVLFQRDVEGLDEARRAAGELFEQNLPAILAAVARRAHDGAADQCYALASHTSVVLEEQGRAEQARGAQEAVRALLGLMKRSEE